MTTSPPPSDRRDKLAIVGGFVRPPEATPAGTDHSSFHVCQAIARQGGFSELHVYQESGSRRTKAGELVLPRTPTTRLFDKPRLSTAGREAYQAIYVANGEQIASVPFVLRPQDDWAPVICSVGTTHIAGQWQNLLVALASASVRRGDGFIFKSRSAQALFRQVWGDWVERFGLQPPPPEITEVIPNGVDVEVNRRSESARAQTRRSLNLGQDDLVFLAFSRLSPGTKGDQLALLVRWREVVARLPRAILILAGAVVSRPFVSELRNLARTTGTADRVVILDNPFELMANPRQQLMSAADVFVHLTTGVEEASSMVVHEALAHALPVIATDWSGLSEVITPNREGFLVETRVLPAADPYRVTQFGHAEVVHAIEASKAVSCAFDQFVEYAVALGDPTRRAEMAAAARRNSEQRTLAGMARKYVAFFGRAAVESARDWRQAGDLRPLVDLDRVLSHQASRGLQADQRLRLADPGRAALLVGTAGEDPAMIERVLSLLEGNDMELGELARQVRPSSEAAAALSRTDAIRAISNLVARMLNYGVIALAPS